MSWFKGLSPLEYSFSDFSSLEEYTMSRMLKEFIVSTLVFEVSFYLGHRAMHLPMLYKHVHAIHHDFETKYDEHVCLANFYSHPLEFGYVYSLILIGTIVQEGHIINTILSSAVAGGVTMYLHTGNDIPGLMGHELHHQRPKSNFGALGLLDFAFGTLSVPGKGAKAL
jgi:methylsterol monooxygenase